MEHSPDPKEDFKKAYRNAYLIAGFIKQNLTTAERDELDEWVASSDDNMRLFEELTDEKQLQQTLDWYRKINVEKGLQETKQRISFKKNRLPAVLKYAAAASLVIAAGIWLYVYNFSGKKGNQPIAKQTDILPGAGKAILTLAGGKVIILQSIKNDTTIGSGIQVLPQNGEIIYDRATGAKELVYNTLWVPRKGHYKLTLPDGTQVWINSESSIKYPVSFIGNERRVFVTGETYFEVAKDKSKPFIAIANDMETQALGTAFNINAYTNEPAMTSTLIRGSVKITKGAASNILMPGQQWRYSGASIDIANIDTDDIIAWKNDQFKFVNAPIDVIMRQVQRWYDAEIVYKDKVNFHLNATIDRTEPVSKLLHLLEATGNVHFKIEGRTIFVMN